MIRHRVLLLALAAARIAEIANSSTPEGEVHDYARLGGTILFGTDAGYLPDYDPTTEYVLMQSAGLGWREILASLTTAPAARFGEASRRGRIVPGMDADLVVLGADPVTDVWAFTNVRYTVRAGRVIYSSSR